MTPDDPATCCLAAAVWRPHAVGCATTAVDLAPCPRRRDRAGCAVSGDPAVEELAWMLDVTDDLPHMANTPTAYLRTILATAVLDALPALLRADGPAGDALRARLGIRWVAYTSPGGFTWRRLADDWEQTS